MKIKKKNLTRLASLSALGAGALAVTARDAHATTVYTLFTSPDNRVGFSANTNFKVSQVQPPGYGGFNLFRSTHHSGVPSNSNGFSRIGLSGFGLQFQEAGGPGVMWSDGGSAFNFKTLRLRHIHKGTFTTHHPEPSGFTTTTSGAIIPTGFHSVTAHHSIYNASIPTDRTGDFYLLFKFNPTGSQDLYGWLHLFGEAGDPLNTVAVEMAFDDAGARIAAGQTDLTSTPEPANAIPTSLGALALGAVGVRRWRKSRKLAA